MKKQHLFFLKGLFVIFSTWGIYFVFLWPKMLFWNNSGIMAGWVGIWGDWAAHFSYANVFAYRQPSDWLTIHPLYHGRKFTYPFFADMISGLLIRFGIDPVLAFTMPSLVATFFLLSMLYLFYRCFLKSNAKVFIAITLFLTSGGIGFYWFIKDFLQKPSVDTLMFPPREYTHISDKYIEWLNIVVSEFIPQRAFLLGMPIVLIFLISIIKLMQSDFRNTSFVKLVLLGIFSSFMLMIHVHAYMAFVIFCSIFFASNIKHWKYWLIFAVSAAIPSIAIYYLLYGDISASHFFSWFPGWLANPKSKNINFFYFWWLNWGVFLPLSLWSIWIEKYYKNSVIVGGVLIFTLANLILFQPWDWDNSKMLTWSYLVFCIPVTAYLANLWRKNIFTKIAAIILFFLMTVSGSLDLWRITRTEKLVMQMWSNSDIALAKEFREISKATDRVLTSDSHTHWVSTLAGRQIILGFKGWIWSYGINYGETSDDIMKMFAGGFQTEELLKKYNISYVVIGPAELNGCHANEKYFNLYYNKVLENNDYRVYDVNQRKLLNIKDGAIACLFLPWY